MLTKNGVLVRSDDKNNVIIVKLYLTLLYPASKTLVKLLHMM